MNLSEKDKKYLENYNSEKYSKPSLTTDVLLFTISEDHQLQVLLVRRDESPYENCWALPGGFVGYEESLEAAAKRQLKDETNLDNIPIEQLYTFGDVNRDPRMRVISVAYMALVSKNKVTPRAGTHVRETIWATVSLQENHLMCAEKLELAFDHQNIIETGIRRLIGKLSYTTIATNLLENDQCFTIAQLRIIHEVIMQKKLDVANFRRDFRKIYEDEGLAEETGELDTTLSKRPSKTYRLKK